MIDGYLLGENDRNLLRMLVKKVGLIPNSTDSRTEQSNDAQTAPEVYIAEVPQSGIPAMVGGVPGYADGVKIFRILGDSTNSPVMADAGFYRRVYNLSPAAIPGSEGTGTGQTSTESFILVIRDKFGLWFVESGTQGTGGSVSCAAVASCLGLGSNPDGTPVHHCTTSVTNVCLTTALLTQELDGTVKLGGVAIGIGGVVVIVGGNQEKTSTCLTLPVGTKIAASPTFCEDMLTSICCGTNPDLVPVETIGCCTATPPSQPIPTTIFATFPALGTTIAMFLQPPGGDPSIHTWASQYPCNSVLSGCSNVECFFQALYFDENNLTNPCGFIMAQGGLPGDCTPNPCFTIPGDPPQPMNCSTLNPLLVVYNSSTPGAFAGCQVCIISS